MPIPTEQEIEAEILAKNLTAPRVTPQAVDKQIISTSFCRGTDLLHVALPVVKTSLQCLTICVLVLKNGFTVVGKSACASPANFDEALGKKIAYEDARSQIWQLEGYNLRTKLAAQTAELAVVEDDDHAA